jgi:dephospho-CoA kinase
MIVLGLTGSVGMGKSTVAKMFADEGIPVFDADATVHRLYEGEAAPLIENAFPGTTVQGQVDRERLSAEVVGDKTALAKLESIVHPLVQKARKAFLIQAEKSGAKIAVFDIPLLLEGKGDPQVNKIVVVTAPSDVQKSRVFERSGMTEEKFAAILARQLPDSEKRRRADFIIDTSRGIDAARSDVRIILKKLSQKG